MVCDSFITTKLVNNHENDQKGPCDTVAHGAPQKAALITG
jgi:hypothetical protein